MNLFEKSLEFKGFPIKEAKKQLSEIKKLPVGEFQKWQNSKRLEIMSWHIKNNEFYRKFLQDKGYNFNENTITDWEKIPVINRKDFQEGIENIISNTFDSKDLYTGNTSGSTAEPFNFAKDKFCHAMTWALIYDRYNSIGIDLDKDHQARFVAKKLGFKNKLKLKAKEILAGRSSFNVVDMSDKILEKYVKEFKHKKIDYLYGYPESLVIFAKYLLRKQIVLKTICPTLKCYISTAEMLTETDRKIMESAFGIRIYNEYGSSELDVMAFEDKDGDWVISDEVCYLEVVDDNGNLVPFTEKGHLLVTSLYNKAIPFIRYDVGDIASIKEEKKGNNHLLKSLFGRCNDFILLPDGSEMTAQIVEYVFTELLYENLFIKEYGVRQWSPTKFTLEYVSELELTEDLKKRIIDNMAKYLKYDFELEFRKQDIVARGKSGKLKYFERKF